MDFWDTVGAVVAGNFATIGVVITVGKLYVWAFGPRPVSPDRSAKLRGIV